MRARAGLLRSLLARLRRAAGRRRPRLRRRPGPSRRRCRRSHPRRHLRAGHRRVAVARTSRRATSATRSPSASRKAPSAEKSASTTAEQGHQRPTLTGPDGRRPPGDRQRRADPRRRRWTTSRASPATATATQSNTLDGAITRDRGQALRQRQPAGARPEVDRDQHRARIRAHPGHRAPERHRAGQLAWSRGRWPTPTSPTAGRARWPTPPSPAGCPASSIHRTPLSED